MNTEGRDGEQKLDMGRRLYRLLLALYPGNFRARYGEEMARVFEAEWERASLDGKGTSIAFLMYVLGDVARTAPGEWISETPGPVWLGLGLQLGLMVILFFAHQTHAIIAALFLTIAQIAFKFFEDQSRRGIALATAVIFGGLSYFIGRNLVVGIGAKSEAMTTVYVYLYNVIFFLGLLVCDMWIRHSFRWLLIKPAYRRIEVNALFSIFCFVAVFGGMEMAGYSIHSKATCLYGVCFLNFLHLKRVWRVGDEHSVASKFEQNSHE